MKHIIYNIAGLALGVMMSLSATSCTDYLDKSADTDVSETVAFQNFKNFQGFIEEIYNCIPEKESCFWCTTFNWGEDEIMNDGAGNGHLSHHMDLGDYRHWMNDGQNYLGGPTASGSISSTSTDKFHHKIYPHAWYCIRKCNYGLQNLDLFVGTTEEKNFIEGQLYFFRAWWHNELMMYFGGLPYVDEVLDGSQPLSLPRLSYDECAKRVAEDFKKAAQLLPSNWDKTTVGRKNQGKNDLLVTKTVALAYAGKALLWAASPLMNNGKGQVAPKGEMTAGAKTYVYDTELAAQAADALGACLNEVATGKTPYALVAFNYSDIYTHTKADDGEANYSDIFYTSKQNWKMAGATEALMRGTQTSANGSNWNFSKLWGSKINGLVEHDKIIHMPTANYVNYAYGMKNGLPISDPNSGFDPTHPFKDRDPRFYHDIVFDGMRYVVTVIEDDDANRTQQYADFQTDHEMRNAELGSRTGYFCQKLNPIQSNMYDKLYEWAGSLQCYLPYMRLADVYLMYAEAVVAAKKGNGSVTSSKTAVEAINDLRDRVGADHVSDSYTGSYEKLMDEIRRERACELAFEGFRWNDLQRWMLLTSSPYNVKTSQEFTRVMENVDLETKKQGVIKVENEWYRNNDPAEAEVKGWTEKEITTRLLGTKHYWFPLPDADVYLYEDFAQNPGW